ncbi:hypothetical protein K474DRAFT_1679169 [Panus rudis PR-1116 ss-1]|nr:hypothetical protein K474DRAFT_1679169 [Panus rudis PR-1116 ss-1]
MSTPSTAKLSESFQFDDADVILRAGGKEFRVHKLLMGCASPVWKDMFSLPPCGKRVRTDPDTKLPIIEISESAEVTHAMLSLIYPSVSPPVLKELDLFSDLLCAFDKYMMDGLKKRALALLALDIANSNPIRLFLVARMAGLEDIALSAARQSLRYPWAEIVTMSIPEYKTAPILILQNLIAYHQECSSIAVKTIRTSITGRSDVTGCWETCRGTSSCPPSFRFNSRVTAWFEKYLDEVQAALHLWPDSSQILQQKTLETWTDAKSCKYCGPRYVADLVKFNTWATQTMNAAILQASLKISLAIKRALVSILFTIHQFYDMNSIKDIMGTMYTEDRDPGSRMVWCFTLRSPDPVAASIWLILRINKDEVAVMSRQSQKTDFPSQAQKHFTSEFQFEDADVIIRADDEDFRVHKFMLASTSPVFKAMFSMPQSKQDCAGIPVIPIAETAATTHDMLCLAYPYIDDPVLDSLETIRTLVLALSKYDMAPLLKRVLTVLEQTFAQSDPVRVFILARSLDLQDTALVAARHTLRKPWAVLVDMDLPEFDTTTFREMQVLIRFHKRCELCAAQVVDDTGLWVRWDPMPSWAKCRIRCELAHNVLHRNTTVSRFLVFFEGYDPFNVPTSSCDPAHGETWQKSIDVAKWWWDYMTAVKSGLLCCPDISQVTLPEHIELYDMAHKCPCCGPKATQEFLTFSEDFKKQIQLAISKVPLIEDEHGAEPQ